MDEDELEAELARDDGGEDEEPAAAEPVTANPTRPARPEGGGGIPAWLKIGAVFVLLGGGVAFLLWGTDASDAFVYSKLVDEVMSEPERYRDREIRVEGELVQGSLRMTRAGEHDAPAEGAPAAVSGEEAACEHHFVLHREGFEMPVRFPRCVVPDTLVNDMPMDVVVQGQLQADNTFLANEVIPRCPSKYEMRERQENGEEMPHEAPAQPS